MTNYINTKDIKESASLIDLLSHLGFHPIRSTGKEKLYISMIRDSDTNPSFSVNDKLSVWYDHGTGKGGNIIDFGLSYWPQLSFQEVLEKISAICALPLPLDTAEIRTLRRRAVKVPNYKIEEIKDIGSNPAITSYLESRHIYTQATLHLKEVYYFVENEKKQRKHFFAAGWQNELGFWEVRNKYFKGCLGRKAMTFLAGDKSKLSIFEGFINYLSWAAENPFTKDSILVLNTITLLFAATKKANDFSKVSLYFDQDKVGFKASLDFIEQVPQAQDCSSVYKGFNDYNELLQNNMHISNGQYQGRG